MQLMRKLDKQLICADLFSGQRVLVVGLGKTGMACVRFLADRNVDFAVMDSREQPPGMFEVRKQYPDVKIYTGSLNEAIVGDFDTLVVSPGVALKEPALQFASKAGKQIIGDIEILARCTSKPIVAITGSNGKSTVTTLLGEMARMAQQNVVVAGNIGLPVLDVVDQDDATDRYVLELSSFQLETTSSLDAEVNTILNVSEDHMDRYGSLSEYAEAKLRITSGNGTLVVNLDDKYVFSLIKDKIANRKTFYFTLSEPETDDQFGLVIKGNEAWLCRGKQELIPASGLKLKGKHNLANVLAALALGTAIHLPLPAMLEAAQQFAGLPHRTQWIAEAQGVQWFNDSKATNVSAALAAIEGMGSDNLILIMGGQGKGQDFSGLRIAAEKHAKKVLLIGEDANEIAGALGNKVDVTELENLDQAVATAKQVAREGDIVLLTPACASFDMFNGYEHRGKEFIRLVEEVTS